MESARQHSISLSPGGQLYPEQRDPLSTNPASPASGGMLFGVSGLRVGPAREQAGARV